MLQAMLEVRQLAQGPQTLELALLNGKGLKVGTIKVRWPPRSVLLPVCAGLACALTPPRVCRAPDVPARLSLADEQQRQLAALCIVSRWRPTITGCAARGMTARTRWLTVLWWTGQRVAFGKPEESSGLGWRRSPRHVRGGGGGVH